MGNNNHTKGKWEIITNHPVFDGKIIIAVKDNERSNSFRDSYKAICQMLQIKGDSFTDNSEDTEANAKLIVKAVNNHAKLVEALQNIVDYEERCRAKGNPNISDHWFNPAKKLLQSIEQQ